MFKIIEDKIKEWQTKGIWVPMVSDQGKPSVTLTLVWISSTMILVGLVGKASGFLGGIDMESALWWHGLSLGAYLNRKYSKDKGLGTSKKEGE